MQRAVLVDLLGQQPLGLQEGHVQPKGKQSQERGLSGI